jgi:hypothetical protein
MDRGGGAEMLKTERCTRCKKGDVALDRDQYGWYEYCIQCGYMHDLIGVAESGQQEAGGIKERRRGVRIPGKGK